MNRNVENGSNLNQVILGLLAALVSVAVVFGSLMLALKEGSTDLVFAHTGTPAPTSAVITPLPTNKPGQPTLPRMFTATNTQETLACAFPAGWVAYTVQSGDTLQNLAEAYGVSLEALQEANCLRITSLLPGLIVYVPARPEEQPSDTPEPEASVTPIQCGPYPGWVPYRVQPGDYLLALARATGTTVTQIKFANCLTRNNIVAGETLYLPYKPPTSTPEPTATVITPQISLVKTANTANFDQPGDPVNYSFQLENTGNVTLLGPFGVSDNNTNVNCPSTGSLAPGANLTCSGSYSVTQADLDVGSVTNTATGRGFYNGNPVISNTASQTVNAVQSPELSLNKNTSSGSYSAIGENLSYSYQLSNSGNVTLSGSFSVSDNNGSVSCSSPGSLAPGANFTCTGNYAVSQDDLDAGSVTNTATAQAFFDGNGVTSNADSVTVSANQNPAVGLTKSASPASFAFEGDPITYSYEVSNNGNVTLGGPFSVSDDMVTVNCSNPGSLAPGGTITCSATYVVTAADVTVGQVTNTASASASFNGNAVNSNSVELKVNGP